MKKIIMLAGAAALLATPAFADLAGELSTAQTHAGMAEQAGGHDQLLRPGGAMQEVEVRPDAELDIRRRRDRHRRRKPAHAKMPCRYQRSGAGAAP